MNLNWNEAIHRHWLAGNRPRAMQEIMAAMQKSHGKRPFGLAMQFIHYLTLLHEWPVALAALEDLAKTYPGNAVIQRNIALAALNVGAFDRADVAISETLAETPDDHISLDILNLLRYRQGRFEEAAIAGSASLRAKALASTQRQPGWSLPSAPPRTWLASATQPRQDVISFSLFGSSPRYLRGAFDNIRAARNLYQEWQVRFYVDPSVPPQVVAGLEALGAQIVRKPAGLPVFRKLAWRFEVADDPSVGRFLVRDADCVLSARERAAVDAWIASDRWFHIMRDWWVHGALVLAGMWGGVATVLPSMKRLLDRYTPHRASNTVADQDFLRERLWPYLNASCLVHDRCFNADGVERWPVPAPAGDDHVGINVFAAEEGLQAERVKAFICENLGEDSSILHPLGL